MEFLDDPDPMMLNAQFEPIQEEDVRHDAEKLSVVHSQKAYMPFSNSGGMSPNKMASRHSSQRSATGSAHHKQNEVGKYAGEEDNIICGRFPHLDVCACEIQCSIALREINLFEVYPGILMGPYQSAFKTKNLIDLGVTHILNVTCREYMRRRKYFKYLDVQIYDTHSEEAKKHFRITNRFIEEARRGQNGTGKVLVHSVQGKSRAPTFILAYLIGKEKMKLKDGINLLKQFVTEVEPNDSFQNQLAEYDLEILSKY